MTNLELSIVLTDNAHIKVLNAEWRDEDKATDVLSFPLYEPFEIPDYARAIGDIVVSLEYAETTTAGTVHLERMEKSLGEKIEKWDLIDEVIFLLIHGLLHLVGYDHVEAFDEEKMKNMEVLLWKTTVD